MTQRKPMLQRLKTLLITLLMLAMSVATLQPVHAKPLPATEYIKIIEAYRVNGQKNDLFWLLVMLKSQYTGMGWANVRVENERGRKIYCPPGQLRVTKEMLFDILKNYAENTRVGRKLGWLPYGGVLLNAVIAKWPCR